MIIYKDKTETIKVPDHLICDVCKEHFDVKKDWGESNCFIHINFVGQYASIFGDGNLVKCDICQKCFKKILGQYLTVEERNNWMESFKKDE